MCLFRSCYTPKALFPGSYSIKYVYCVNEQAVTLAEELTVWFNSHSLWLTTNQRQT